MLHEITSILDRLKSVLSPAELACVRADSATLLSHRCQGVLPAAVAFPENVLQVSALIRAASLLSWPVVPYGNGTGQGIGLPPPSNAILISTRNLNQMIQHEPGDMVVTVQAGVQFGEFQKMLKSQGQWLPLDADPLATLGGLLATDRHGPRSYGYGTLRDMVLGLTVVNGDGVIRKCGGRVVKNVTGYALDKLYVGSMGTLGIMTEVTFKLRPLSIATRYWRLNFKNHELALSQLSDIFARNLPLEMVTFNFSRNASAKEGEGCFIAVLASGAPADLDRITRELQCQNLEITDTHAHDAGLSPWFSLMCPKSSIAPNVWIRVWSLPTRLKKLWSLISSDASQAVLSPQGGWFCSQTPVETLRKTLARLDAEGFNWRVENTVGIDIKEPFGASRPEWALMKNIHQALDPNAIMSRGRFVV